MVFEEIKPFVRFVRRLIIKNNSDFQKSLPLDARLFYVLDGTGKIEIGNEILTLPSGSVTLINSGVIYRLLPCEACYLAVNFDFTQNFSTQEAPIPPVNMENYNYSKPLERVLLSDAQCLNEYCFFENFHSLQGNLLKLEKENISKLLNYKEVSSALMTVLLTEVVRRSQIRDFKDTRFNIEEILDYIELHYKEPIDNGLLGKIFSFHPNYISAEFKRSTGKSVHRFLLETRIMNAISMMESGKRNIREISELSGFSDSNYFSRYFKKIIGITPKEYIKGCLK